MGRKSNLVQRESGCFIDVTYVYTNCINIEQTLDYSRPETHVQVHIGCNIGITYRTLTQEKQRFYHIRTRT